MALCESTAFIKKERGRSTLLLLLTKLHPAQRQRVAKTLLLMKLTFILLTAVLLQAHASGVAQTITFRGRNVPIQKVFSAIEKQTGYVVFYNKDLLQKAGTVTCTVQNIPLNDFLTIALKDQPLYYEISGKTILIARKALPLPVVDQQAPLTNISGSVYTTDGKPLADATVRIKGTASGTHTDAAGKFSIEAQEGQTIVISFVGYKDREIKIGNNKSVVVIMEISVSPLDQVVYKGYYSTSRRLSTGSETQISSAEIEKQPVANVLQALQGRVTGMMVTQMSGSASSTFNVLIRGQNSIAFSSDPLFVIDGVPMMAGAGSAVNTYSMEPKNLGLNQNFMVSGITQSPIFSMNPSDIESITVLKDADATAIYGSQGANGVILINTKRGKPGKTKFDVNVYTGTGKTTRMPKLLNTEEYLTIRREAYKNDNLTPNATDAPDLVKWDQERYTNWQDYLIGGTARTADLQAGFSGGDEYTTYRVSGSFHHQTDVAAVSGADKRGAMNVSLNSASRNRKFRLTMNGSYSNVNTNMISMDKSLIILPPNAPSVFDENGNLNWTEWGSYNSGFLGLKTSNPFGFLYVPYEAVTDNLQSSLNLQYQPISKLTIRANGGYSLIQNNQLYVTPKKALNPTSGTANSTRFGSNAVKTWIIEPQAEYITNIAQGRLSVLAGGTFQNTLTKAFNATATDFSNEALIRSMNAAREVKIYTDNYTPYRYNALFGRLNYIWANKYLLNATARRDGSSRFGPGKQFGNFGALGAAWIISEEPFMQTIPAISFAKLRSSYGITGSANIGDYNYMSRWQGTSYPYQGTATLSPAGHYDSTYGWEVNKKLEVGLELGFFKDRLQVSASWYRNRSDNQLVSFPLPAYTGFTGVTTNLPALVQNVGMELQINSSNIKTKDFNWNTSFNITRAKNKLIAYPDLELSPYATKYEVGKPLSVARLIHFIGIDEATGKYMFEDVVKDGKIKTTGLDNDLVGMYDLAPAFYGGLQNTLQYKNWQLSFFFQFVKQRGNSNRFSLAIPGSINNQPKEILDRWQNAGDITNGPKVSTILTTDYTIYSNSSDALLVDASYARLQNLSVSYTLPAKWTKKYLAQYSRIYLQGQNLLTITGYKGADPETQTVSALPPVRFITAGLQITF